MKKLLYSILIFITVIIASFLIFVLVLACRGKDFKFLSKFNMNDAKLVKEETYKITDLKEFNIRTIAADVTIIKTDDLDIKVEQYSSDEDIEYYSDSNSNGVLEIEEMDKVCFFCINHRNYFKIYIPESYIEELNIKTTSGDVTAKDDLNYVNLSLRTTSGDIETKDIITSDLYASSTSGDVNFLNVTAKEVTLKTTSGDIETENITADETVLKSVSGDVTIADSNAFTNIKTTSGSIEIGNISNDTTIKSTSGSVNAHRIIGSADIVTTSGTIKLTSFEPTGDSYFKSTSGDVKIGMREASDCSFSLDSSSGDIDYPGKMNNGLHEITVKTTSGDIKIK